MRRRLLGALGFVLGPILGTLLFCGLVLVNADKKREHVSDPRGSAHIARVLRGARGAWFGFSGITFGKYIFFKQIFVPSETLRHEFVHVEQYRRLGWFRFLARYGRALGEYGYYENPFEIEAYLHQH